MILGNMAKKKIEEVSRTLIFFLKTLLSEWFGFLHTTDIYEKEKTKKCPTMFFPYFYMVAFLNKRDLLII